MRVILWLIAVLAILAAAEALAFLPVSKADSCEGGYYDPAHQICQPNVPGVPGPGYGPDHTPNGYVDRGLGWVFSGDVGRGKSLLANLMLKDLIKRGYRCYSTTFAGCIEQFTSKGRWRDEPQTASRP